MDDLKKKSLSNHEKFKGKFATHSKIKITSIDDLSWAYSPGVSAPCEAIAKDCSLAYRYTSKGNTVGVITDGSAVLGMGNIGPDAALPVMEGKAILFKELAGVDAIPLCIDEKNTDAFIETCIRLAPSFGGINLEDIAAPKCFEIERRLIEALDIPVFHDDQHGTAIVTAAAMINGARYLKRDLSSLDVLLIGTGAAGNAIAKMLNHLGVHAIQAFNIDGPIHPQNTKMDSATRSLLDEEILRPASTIDDTLKTLIRNKDVVIGVSTGDLLDANMIRSMRPNPMVFALANPTPEINPEIAKEAGAAIVGTGRSDYPNQINNVLAFPGFFRGLLDNRVHLVTEDMKLIAAKAIAATIDDDALDADYIVPSPLDKRVVPSISRAISDHIKTSR